MSRARAPGEARSVLLASDSAETQLFLDAFRVDPDEGYLSSGADTAAPSAETKRQLRALGYTD